MKKLFFTYLLIAFCLSFNSYACSCIDNVPRTFIASYRGGYTVLAILETKTTTSANFKVLDSLNRQNTIAKRSNVTIWHNNSAACQINIDHINIGDTVFMHISGVLYNYFLSDCSVSNVKIKNGKVDGLTIEEMKNRLLYPLPLMSFDEFSEKLVGKWILNEFKESTDGIKKDSIWQGKVRKLEISTSTTTALNFKFFANDTILTDTLIYFYEGRRTSDSDSLWTLDVNLIDRKRKSFPQPAMSIPDKTKSYYITFDTSGQKFTTGSVFTYDNYYTFAKNVPVINSYLSPNADINIYPNPFTNEIIFDNDVLVSKYVVTDLFGNSVLCKNEAGKIIFSSSVSSGVYFLELVFQNGEKIRKKIIKI